MGKWIVISSLVNTSGNFRQLTWITRITLLVTLRLELKKKNKEFSTNMFSTYAEHTVSALLDDLNLV